MMRCPASYRRWARADDKDGTPHIVRQYCELPAGHEPLRHEHQDERHGRITFADMSTE